MQFGKNAYIGDEDMARRRETVNKSLGQGILMEMFNEQPVWDTQTSIKEELEKRGVNVPQPTISRWLPEIGVTRDPQNGKWTRAKKNAYEGNLTRLKKLLEETKDKPPRIFGNVGVAVMTMKEGYSGLIARKIRETFAGEILSVFCPSDREIIIYYRDRKDENGEKLKSRVLSDLRKLCREIKSQQQHGEQKDDIKEKHDVTGTSAIPDNYNAEEQGVEAVEK
jgi:arginine repressor